MTKEDSVTSTVAKSEEQPCVVCRKAIPVGAKKCTYCDSYQDWTRHLLRWSSVTVAFLALVPLWGIFQSLHELAFSKKVPQIQATLTTCRRDVVTAAFINSGTIDGIVTDNSFTLMLGGKVAFRSYAVRATPDEDFVVSPNQPPKLVDFRAYIGTTETVFVPENHGLTKCFFRVAVAWMDFTGRPQTLESTCPCPK